MWRCMGQGGRRPGAWAHEGWGPCTQVLPAATPPFCVALPFSHKQAHFSVPCPKRESGWLSHQRLSLCGPLRGHRSV